MLIVSSALGRPVVATLTLDQKPRISSSFLWSRGLADVALHTGDVELANNLYGQARHLYGVVGSIRGQANCLCGLGAIAVERNDTDAAADLFGQARDAYVLVGSVRGQANCARWLGLVWLKRKDPLRGRSCLEEALSMYRRIPDPYAIALTAFHLSALSASPTEKAVLKAQFREAWRAYGQDLVDNHMEGAAFHDNDHDQDVEKLC